MMKPSRALLLLLAAALIPSCGSGGGDDDGSPPPPTPPLEIAIVALSSGNQLSIYSAASPGEPVSSLAVTGIPGGESLIGIDFRPFTGTFMGVSDASVLYAINTTTGAATSVGSFPTALVGTFFGFDISPSTDRGRLVSDQDQNLRIEASSGALVQVDGNIAYATGDVNQFDNPQVVGIAHASTSTVYGIDRQEDVLVFFSIPVSGILSTVGPLVAGGDVTEASIDITPNNAAFAAMRVGGVTRLYAVSLATGATAVIGQIGTGASIRDIAVASFLPFNPAAGSIVALKPGNVLVNYAAATPGPTLGVLNVLGVTGQLVGIDYRPGSGDLYGVSDGGRLYSINTITGAATALGTAPFTPALSGSDFGIDISPVTNRVRVVGELDQNLRVDLATGAVVDSNTGTPAIDPDGALSYVVTVPADPNEGQNPGVVAVAHTNNVAGALSTLVYGIDRDRDALITLNPPNDGTLNTVFPLILAGGAGLNVTEADLDIDAGGTLHAAMVTSADSLTRLYTINPANGIATPISVLGTGGPIRGLTVRP